MTTTATASQPKGRMNELVLVRHAEAHCNVAGVVGGPNTCTGLTGRGVDQARLLAQRLYRESEAGHPVSHVYGSPRRRARETAEVLAARLGLPVAEIPELRDPDYGDDADGQPWALLLAGAEHVGRRDLPLTPSGESWTRYVARTDETIQRLLAHGSREGRVLVVAHAETVKASFHLFLGLPATQPLPIRIETGHSGLTIWTPAIRHGHMRWTLLAHNDRAHL